MKTYTIVGGVNGVGKSSLTGVLKSRTTDLGVIVDVDKITAQMGGRASIRMIEDCISKGISFTQETTLSGRRTEITAQRVKEDCLILFPTLLTCTIGFSLDLKNYRIGLQT